MREEVALKINLPESRVQVCTNSSVFFKYKSLKGFFNEQKKAENEKKNIFLIDR